MVHTLAGLVTAKLPSPRRRTMRPTNEHRSWLRNPRRRESSLFPWRICSIGLGLVACLPYSTQHGSGCPRQPHRRKSISAMVLFQGGLPWDRTGIVSMFKLDKDEKGAPRVQVKLGRSASPLSKLKKDFGSGMPMDRIRIN